VPVLEKINLANLNRAYRTYRRDHNNEAPELTIRMLRRLFDVTVEKLKAADKASD
jgi:hypothetical protein